MSGVEIFELHDDAGIRTWQEFTASGMPSLIAATHTAQVVQALEVTHILDRIRAGRKSIADGLLDGVVEAFGRQLLRYCVVRGILSEWNGQYSFTLTGEMLTAEIPMARLGFYLDAYGPVLANLADLLTGKAVYGEDIQRRGGPLGRHSGTIFARYYTALVFEAMRGSSCRRVLDLGCGSGQLLIDLVLSDPGVTGVGIDLSPEAVDLAVESARRHGVAERLEFRVADAFAPDTWPDDCFGADTICAIGMLHERFRDGEQAVVGTLNAYANVLAGGRRLVMGEPEPHHDDHENDADFLLVHALTNQGAPADRTTWLRVIDQSRLSCERILTRATAGPRTVFYQMTVKNA